MYVYCRDKAKTQKVKHGQAILENYSILTNKQNAKSSNNRWCNIHTHHFPQGLGPCWHPIHAHRFHWLRHSSAQARFHFCLLQGLEKTALQADWAGQNCQHWNGIQDLYIYIYFCIFQLLYVEHLDTHIRWWTGTIPVRGPSNAFYTLYEFHMSKFRIIRVQWFPTFDIVLNWTLYRYSKKTISRSPGLQPAWSDCSLMLEAENNSWTWVTGCCKPLHFAKYEPLTQPMEMAHVVINNSWVKPKRQLSKFVYNCTTCVIAYHKLASLSRQWTGRCPLYMFNKHCHRKPTLATRTV